MTSPSSEKQVFDLAIIGGGIAGLTLAIALIKRGIKVNIYEQVARFGEIGAGVSFGPNAVRAMEICSDGIFRAFKDLATGNQWKSKEKEFFCMVDGYHHDASKSAQEKLLFLLTNEVGQNAVHRAHFLDELIKLIPEGISHFHKHLDNVTDDENGKLRMKFHDGSEATADAVIGCDGIKSRVRQLILGEDDPASHPQYTYKYAYRGLVPIEKAVEALGEEAAVNARVHMGPDKHVLTVVIDKGKTMNVVAFCTASNPWPDTEHLSHSAQKSAALREFEDWGSNCIAVLNLIEEEGFDIWAIFDTGDHPPRTYYKGRIVISGDAAHASSPHHGAGAGFCIEDSAVLAELLAAAAIKLKDDSNVGKNQLLEAAFATFEAARKERAQWLVQSSRFTGDLYEWRAEGCGSNIEKIQEEVIARNEKIWNYDLKKAVEEALADLRERVS